METPAPSISDPAYLVLIGIIFALIMAFLVVGFFFVYQRRLLQSKQKADQMEKERQKDLIDAGILAQEQDRKRMANDLHDGFGGALSAIKLFIGKLEPNMPEEKFARFQGKAIHTLDENITELRGIINDLLPQSLEDEGLVPAIKVMTHKLESLKGIQVNLQIENERRFAEDKEKAVFRILQELINNAMKYSEAKNLNIDFLFGESQLKIYYREDGPGFDPDILQNEGFPTSYGFKSIASRMAYLNGHFEANTGPNEGFQVHLCIPLATISTTK